MPVFLLLRGWKAERDKTGVEPRICPFHRRTEGRKIQSTFERQMKEDGLTRVFLSDPNAQEKTYSGQRGEVQWRDPTGNLAVLHVMLEKMQNRLKLLPERQRRLLAYHYGFGMLKANSISKTAAYFHLAERTLRKIEKEALGTLREMMNDGKIV